MARHIPEGVMELADGLYLIVGYLFHVSDCETVMDIRF